VKVIKRLNAIWTIDKITGLTDEAEKDQGIVY